MRYKDISKHDLVRLDIILNGSIKSAEYLAILVKHGNDGYVKLLPLKEYFKNNKTKNFIVPCIDMPFSMIKGFEKLDKSRLLYLVNSGNPHILSAINNLMES